MKTLLYSLKTKSPVIISKSSGDINMIATKSYIPANNLIGSLASCFIKENNIKDCKAHLNQDFYDWFLSGKIIFKDAHPANEEKNEPSFPIPFSIQYEKLKSDTLHDLFFEKRPAEQTKQFSGAAIIKDNILTKILVERKLNPHHEVDRETGAVKQSIFFNYESIKEDSCFTGYINVPDELFGKFEAFLKSCNHINLGRSKNTQYGKTLFSIKLIDGKESTPADFEPAKFTLLLASDTIIYNDNGFSSGSSSDLETELKKLFGDNIKIENQLLKIVSVENYVGIWNLKKESDIAFSAGSSLLITGCSLSKEELLKKIQIGIGERRNEGFGSIHILGNCTNLKKADYIKAKNNSLPSEIPANAISTIEDIVISKIKEEAKLTAYKKARGVGILKNSQIGRIESLIKKATNEEQFLREINNIRDTAKDKYKKCHIGNTDLLEYLIKSKYKNDININELITKMNEKYKEIKNPLIVLNGKINEFSFTQLFLTTFLVSLRKKNNGGKK
ncbi:MAG: hypothetical protein M0P71_07975 [Melioribacteraceae bacterium]|nr:hypothetical protein [Melioribacteraceae bacterium]